MSLVSFQLKIPNFKFLTSELIISVIPKLLFYMQDTHETEAQSNRKRNFVFHESGSFHVDLLH